MARRLRWFERLVVRATVRLGWARPAHMADAIRGFQATEADGVWHLHRALERIEDPKVRAIVFTHSLEEESHADDFAAVYRHTTGRSIPPPSFEREELYDPSEPVWKSFAFVHVGEDDATERFRAIRDSLPEGRFQQALTSIVRDEDQHIGLTHGLLARLGATPADVRREVRRVRLRRALAAWMRVGRRVVDAVATVLLSVIYFALGPFGALAARRRMGGGLVSYDNNHRKRLG